jgi:polyhydroxybutyrate depolymerase
MKKIITVSIICLFLIPQFKAQITTIKQIVSGGINRDYRLYTPPAYDGFYPVPLVINLHGKTSTASQHDTYCRMNLVADTGNFILVHPNGMANQRNVREWWPVPSSSSVPPNIDDVQFIRDVIDNVSSLYNIDPNRIYIVGFSNGANMAHSLAKRMSDKIAAICTNAGALSDIQLGEIGVVGPVHPMPILNMHGTADPLAPYFGSSLFLSADSLVKKYASFNGCNMTPITTAIPNINLADNSTADRRVYSGANPNANVEFITIYGGQHSWPGSPSNSRGITCRDFNASAEAWKFFLRYSLDQFGGGMLAPIGSDDEQSISSELMQSQKLISENIQEEFIAFPNPFENKFQITLPEYSSLSDISIYNIFGKEIPLFMNPINNSVIDIETSGWPTGVYNLIINNSKNSVHKKIIKEVN